jgi:hypothetical protein
VSCPGDRAYLSSALLVPGTGLRLQSIEADDAQVTIVVQTIAAEAECPD